MYQFLPWRLWVGYNKIRGKEGNMKKLLLTITLVLTVGLLCTSISAEGESGPKPRCPAPTCEFM